MSYSIKLITNVWDLIDNPQFLYLTTKGWKTGKQHKIEIWFVRI